MATLLDSHSSSFSILERALFQLDFVQSFQANYGESIIQKIGVYEHI